MNEKARTKSPQIDPKIDELLVKIKADQKLEKQRRVTGEAFKAMHREVRSACDEVRIPLESIILLHSDTRSCDLAEYASTLTANLRTFGEMWRVFEAKSQAFFERYGQGRIIHGRTSHRVFGRYGQGEITFGTTLERVEGYAKDNAFTDEALLLFQLMLIAFNKPDAIESACAQIIEKQRDGLTAVLNWLPFFTDVFFPSEFRVLRESPPTSRTRRFTFLTSLSEEHLNPLKRVPELDGEGEVDEKEIPPQDVEWPPFKTMNWWAGTLEISDDTIMRRFKQGRYRRHPNASRGKVSIAYRDLNPDEIKAVKAALNRE